MIRVGSQLTASPDDAPTRPSSGPIGWSAILATAMLELLLAWRSRGFWAVQVVLLAPALLVLVPDGLDGHFLRYASDQLRQFVAFTALLMPLLVLPTLFRTRGTEGDLTFATTHDGSAHALGTLLGLFGWLVPTVLAHLGARWLLGEVVSGQANWTLLTVGPVLALASLTLCVGVLALLSLLLARRLPILLVWIGLWVVILQWGGGLFGGFGGPYMPLLDTWNVFYEGVVLSPSVGLGWSRDLVMGLAQRLALIGALFLTCWLLLAPRFDTRRAIRWRAPPIMVLLLVAAGVAFSFRSFQIEAGTRLPVDSPRITQLDEWTVLNRNLTVAFEPGNSVPIRGRSVLTLLHRDGEVPDDLVLRLRPGMSISARSSDEPLVATRTGDSVELDLAGARGGADGSITLSIDFEGEPRWAYSDYRFEVGAAFPATDSAQPVTSAAAQGVGYLLRDGDWSPWPWTTRPQIPTNEQRVTITVIDQTGASHDVEYTDDVPQLLAAVPPLGGWRVGRSDVRAGTDAGAGLAHAMNGVASAADTLWNLLGEPSAPTIVALPYLPDAYANSSTIVIPEAFDLSNSLLIGAAYRPDLDLGLAERAAFQLLARAWLNGNARHPRAFAEATRSRGELQASRTPGAVSPQSGTSYRLLQVVPIGPLGTPWADIWLGTDPSRFDISSFALWLGIEFTDSETRAADLALLRSLSGSNRQTLALSARGLPWGLVRQSSATRLVVALADWAAVVGREEAVRHFAFAYRNVGSQDHESLLTAMAELSGVSVPFSETEGER